MNYTSKQQRSNVSLPSFFNKTKNSGQALYTSQEIFFRTIQQRGFLNKQTQEQLMSRAKIYDLEKLVIRLEGMMDLFVSQNSQQTLAVFIINNLLQTEPELNLVEQELLSIWATLQEYKDRDTLIMMFNDFVNDVLKGPTHLLFYMHCQKVISQLINGDQSRKSTSSRNQLTSQHFKMDRISELIPKIFTPTTLLQIYEQNIKLVNSAKRKVENGNSSPQRGNDTTFEKREQLTNDMLKNI